MKEPWNRWDARLFAWFLRVGWGVFRALIRDQPPLWSPYWSQHLPTDRFYPIDYEEPGFKWVL